MSKTVAHLVKERIAQQDADLAKKWESTFITCRPQDKSLSRQEQIRAINHFWRVQLGGLPTNTTDERECLVDDASLSDWIRNFDECVVPTIVEHRLPIT